MFVRPDGSWLTPPLSLGILPGVMRTRLLRGDVSLDAPVREAVITCEMLAAPKGWCCVMHCAGFWLHDCRIQYRYPKRALNEVR